VTEGERQGILLLDVPNKAINVSKARAGIFPHVVCLDEILHDTVSSLGNPLDVVFHVLAKVVPGPNHLNEERKRDLSNSNRHRVSQNGVSVQLCGGTRLKMTASRKKKQEREANLLQLFEEHEWDHGVNNVSSMETEKILADNDLAIDVADRAEPQARGEFRLDSFRSREVEERKEVLVSLVRLKRVPERYRLL